MSIEEQNKEMQKALDSTADILVTELCMQGERIAQLENGLDELKSQLIDYGFNENSVIIISINELKNK